MAAKGEITTDAAVIPSVMRKLDRPVTARELRNMLGMSKNKVSGFLERAFDRGEMRTMWRDNKMYWELVGGSHTCYRELTEALGLTVRDIPPAAREQARVYESRFRE
jgi:hypothetical protein